MRSAAPAPRRRRPGPAGSRRTRPTAAPPTSGRTPGPAPGCGRRAASCASGRARPWSRSRARPGPHATLTQRRVQRRPGPWSSSVPGQRAARRRRARRRTAARCPRKAIATPDRAEDDVLPGRLERAPGAVVADEERRRDGGRLDRDPHDPEVVGEHGQGHRAEEQADQGGVRRGSARGILPAPSVAPSRRDAGCPRWPSARRRPRRASMYADSASARSRPPAAGGDAGPRRTAAAARASPLASTATLASDPGDAASPAPGRPQTGDGQQRPARRAGPSRKIAHQSRSSVSSSRSVSPNLACMRSGQDLQDQHHQQHVERGAQLDDERHPAGGEERHRRDAVVDAAGSPTSWDSARRRVTSSRKPISTREIPMRHGASRRVGAGADERPADEIGQDRRAATP